MIATSYRRWLMDALFITVIFAAGAYIGSSYRKAFVASGAPQAFGQPEFGAAVAFACGHGFVDPGYGFTPALDGFLNLKTDTYSCDDLPASLSPKLPNLTQGLYRYLMTTVAVVWKFRGISWSGLTPLFGLMYGSTLVAAYGLFRLLVGRLSALAATSALAISVIHLSALPQLRDYAKAPFILALVLLMGLMVQRPLRPRRAMTIAVAFGVTLGIGFGFRNDLLINLLPWTAVVMLCLPGTLQSNIRLKLTCLAISGGAFVIAAWPILTAYSRGSNSGHVAFLGLMSSFNIPLGIDSSIYSWGYVYSDEFASTFINSFTYRTYGHEVRFLSPEYDQAMVAYLLRIARHWPADMVTRMYASVLKMLEMPFFVGGYTNPTPHGIVSQSLQTFYDHQADVLRSINGWGVYAAATALLIIGAVDVRAALTLLIFLVYFAGYPVVQFNVRHFFHLEFIAWGAFALLLDRVLAIPAGVWRSRRRWIRREFWAPAFRSVARMTRNVAIVAVAAAVLSLAPVAVLRAYQTAHVRTMFAQQYLGARRERLDQEVTAAGGRILIGLPSLWQSRPSGEEVSTAYLVLEFSPQACDALFVPVSFHYDRQRATGDFSHDVNVPLGDDVQPTVVLAPVFYDELSHFDRIEVPAEDAVCLTAVSRIAAADVPEVLLDGNFTPHWKDEALYQSIRGWEMPLRLDALPALYLNPPSLVPPRRMQPRPFTVSVPADRSLVPIVKDGPNGSLVFKGQPDGPLSYAVMIKNQQLPAGSTLLARGFLRHGGITVGLLKNGQWAGNINVATAGPFVVALAVNDTANYSVVIANFVKSGENDVVISALGWVPPR